MAEKISTLVLKVDLYCTKCYKKIKKILCQFHCLIQDQKYDFEQNTVTIKGCFDPECFSKKLRCKAGKVIKCIQIKPPPPPPPPPPDPEPECFSKKLRCKAGKVPEWIYVPVPYPVPGYLPCYCGCGGNGRCNGRPLPQPCYCGCGGNGRCNGKPLPQPCYCGCGGNGRCNGRPLPQPCYCGCGGNGRCCVIICDDVFSDENSNNSCSIM